MFFEFSRRKFQKANFDSNQERNGKNYKLVE